MESQKDARIGLNHKPKSSIDQIVQLRTKTYRLITRLWPVKSIIASMQTAPFALLPPNPYQDYVRTISVTHGLQKYESVWTHFTILSNSTLPYSDSTLKLLLHCD